MIVADFTKWTMEKNKLLKIVKMTAILSIGQANMFKKYKKWEGKRSKEKRRGKKDVGVKIIFMR